MNIDVGSSLALIAGIVAPVAALGWMALKRYARAHRDLLCWQGSHPEK